MLVNYRKMGNNGAEKERVLVNDTNGWLEMRNCNGSECKTLQTTYLYREKEFLISIFWVGSYLYVTPNCIIYNYDRIMRADSVASR